jgi:hypothetical protein
MPSDLFWKARSCPIRVEHAHRAAGEFLERTKMFGLWGIGDRLCFILSASGQSPGMDGRLHAATAECVDSAASQTLLHNGRGFEPAMPVSNP